MAVLLTVEDYKSLTKLNNAKIIEKINEAADAAFKAQKVGVLPETGEDNVIYLVPKTTGSEDGNVCEEFMYIDGAFEKIGDTKVDLSEYAKTAEVDEKLTLYVKATDLAATLQAYYTSEQIDTKLGDYVTTTVFTAKADELAQALADYKTEVSSTYATKESLTAHEATAAETYATKTEMQNALDAITGFNYSVVDALPEAGEKGYIYLVPFATEDQQTGDVYTEYIWVNNKFEKIGTTRVDLSGYALTETVNQQIAGVNTAIQDHIATAEATYAKKTEVEATYAKKTEVEATYAKKTDVAVVDKITADEQGNITIDAPSVTVAGATQSESDMNSIIGDIWA